MSHLNLNHHLNHLVTRFVPLPLRLLVALHGYSIHHVIINGSIIDIRKAWFFPTPGSAMQSMNRFRTYTLGPIRAATVVSADLWK